MPSGTTEIASDVARRLRLRTQGLWRPDGGTGSPEPAPVDVVRRMVALQGQDLPAVLRAIAIRSRPGTTVEDVRAAFDAGDLVRGWTQRGTLFATTPGDLAALVSLTAERVTQQGRRTREAEGLDDALVDRVEALTREALAAPGNVSGITRAAMLDLWQQAGVPVEGQRGYHLIVSLALRGVLHWGPFAGAQQLMVATPRSGSGDAPTEQPGAALRRIARSYFTSRGPATVDDLAWWLGLPKTPVRAAVSALREAEPDTLVEVIVDGTAMLVGREPDPRCLGGGSAAGLSSWLTEPCGVVLVPGFDEMVLGYQDRGLIADAEAMRTVVPFTNGIFRPAVLLDGRLIGTWRRAPKPDQAPFELVPGIRTPARTAVDAAVTAWHLG
ncbi:Winged helix DNA-binding domain-containing protein [Promicromonospora umidemergens]|uniref:Crosslink repair DNA glycosylase YcaQ family protein n=1 Tax=Promicromonospora umidemergens TaxID=629679 RepID=A0ABP8WP79_9MICO|nr:winged helix DNA-binding domain-containing protein [Promicromonospora umidemergens]MCP2283310.1 Winged helix DNA-binding domain-containing protein [Promicromonospora umidemergens]